MAKTKKEIQKDYEKRTNYAAIKKYQKESTQEVRFRLFKNTEQDIIQKLASVSNKSGYIKNLIRQDINQNNQTIKHSNKQSKELTTEI